MKIAGSKLNQGLDGVADIVCIHEGDSVKIHSDKRKLLIPATDIIERISSLERIGETLPTEVQGANFIEVIPAPPAPVAAPAPESADPAQDTPPLNISADEKDLTPIDLDLPLLTPNS